MRKILTSAVAMTSLMALSACGGENAENEDQMASEEMTEEAPAAEEAAEDTAAASEPEVEANGNVIEIEMLTRDPDGSGMQVFRPRLVEAEVGDTVTFVPTDPTHQSSSIEGMVPEGARGWEGEINQEVSYVLPEPGVYGYQCVPHYAAGMVGMIVVGDESEIQNVEEAMGVSHPGLAGDKFEEIFEEANLG